MRRKLSVKRFGVKSVSFFAEAMQIELMRYLILCFNSFARFGFHVRKRKKPHAFAARNQKSEKHTEQMNGAYCESDFCKIKIRHCLEDNNWKQFEQ